MSNTTSSNSSSSKSATKTATTRGSNRQPARTKFPQRSSRKYRKQQQTLFLIKGRDLTATEKSGLASLSHVLSRHENSNGGGGR